MATATDWVGSLTIPNGTKPTNELNPQAQGYAGPINMTIIAPGTLTGTVTLQVASAIGGTYADLQDPPGTGFTVAAGKAVIIRGLLAAAIRLNSGSNEGADRVFSYRISRASFDR